MDTSRLPESLRARIAERDALPPLEKVRSLLRAHVADTDGTGEVRAELEMAAQAATGYLRQQLAAVEEIVTGDLPPGTLLRVVERDGSWPLDDDPTDAGAATFLRQLAVIMHEVIDEAERRER